MKALLTLPARLEFCPEAPIAPGAHCEPHLLPDGGSLDAVVSRVPDDSGLRACHVMGLDAEAVRAATAFAPGQRVLVGPLESGGLRSYVAAADCLVPRIMKAEAAPGPVPMVHVIFDGPTSARFADLTAALVKRRLLIVIDDVVTSAPVVQEAITGGRAMVTTGAAASAEQLAIALEGGPLGGSLSLLREGAYGPPRLAP